MKLFNEEFILGLDDDPKAGLYSICSFFMTNRANSNVNLESHFETYALI